MTGSSRCGLTAAVAIAAIAFVFAAPAQAGTTLEGGNGPLVFSNENFPVNEEQNGSCHTGGFEPFTPNCGDIFTIDAFSDAVTGPLQGNPNADDDEPVWSPDGTKIAFESNRDCLPEPEDEIIVLQEDCDSGRTDIYVMNADGGGLQRLTSHPCDDQRPSWSPDGTRIAFESDRFMPLSGQPEEERCTALSPEEGTAFRRIWVMDSNGDNEVPLTNGGLSEPGGLAADFAPAWSPRGDEIAFTSLRPVSQQQGPLGFDVNTFIVPVNSNGERTGPDRGPLADTPDALDLDIQPTWRPDGGRIAFASIRGCNLFLNGGGEGASIDALDAYRLLDSVGILGLQERIGALQEPGEDESNCGGFDIFSMHPGGSDVQRHTDDSPPGGTCTEFFQGECYSDMHPAWSPDGRLIAFHSDRPGPGDESRLRDFSLWTVTVAENGSLDQIAGVPLVTDANNGFDVAPDWQSLRADLEVAKTGPPLVGVGDLITYTLTVRNGGPSPAVNARIDDTLPAGTTFEGATGATCSGGAPLTCQLGTLSPGQVVGIQVTVRASAPGTVTNSVVTASDTFDPNLGNNTASADTTVVAAQVVLDTAAPSVRASGVRARCARRPFNVRVTISDASPTVRTVVFLDGRRLLSTRQRSFRVRVPALGLRPGVHRLVIRSTDAEGNRRRRVIRFRVCAAQAPQPEFTG